MIEKALSIKGFMTPPELQWLADTARVSECIVEIGTYYGRSARALADNTNGKVYCIDPYPGTIFNTYGKASIASGNYVYEQCKLNLKDHLDSGKVIIHRGTVLDFPHNIKPDLVFIDGNHLRDALIDDLMFAEAVLNKGIVAGHDYDNPDWPAVKELVDINYPTIGRKGLIWYVTK